MRISERVRKCVAFACYRDKADKLRYAGTVFFTHSEVDKELGKVYIVTVTAKHVIIDAKRNSIDQKVVLCLNRLNGGSEYIDTDIQDWKFHPDPQYPADVAILAWSPSNEFDWQPIPISIAATDDVVKEEVIGLGNEVFVVGLFRGYWGKKKIQPVVRVGNIAMLPDEYIPTKEFGDIEAYLIEGRSTGGLSGSPVFVEGFKVTSKVGTWTTWDTPLYLLGLIHGHYDVKLPAEDGLVEDAVAAEVINQGIAIVIPAKKVVEAIEQPEMVAMKEAERKKLLELNLLTENSLSDEDRPPDRF